MQFQGYLRPDGRVGARNHIVVIPAGNCTNELATAIANENPGVIVLPHNHPCIRFGEDTLRAKRCLIGLGSNPNVAATLVVGIGCENPTADELADEISKSEKWTEALTIETEENYSRVIKKSARILQEMKKEAESLPRQDFDVSHLTIGIKCGGSHPISALAGNPAIGKAIDFLINQGGTAIFSETVEIFGAENLLVDRTATPEVATALKRIVREWMEKIKSTGVDIRGSEPTPGNIKSGLSTLEEKSLGAIIKSGTHPLMGVLEYAFKPQGTGLYFMDGPANTPQLFLGMSAAGAQIQLFSIGGGLPARFRTITAYPGGLPILPVITILSSPEDVKELNYFDFYAGTIIEGEETLDLVGKRILDEIIRVASGKKTKTELRTGYLEPIQMYTTEMLL